jgi:rhodanese-related sulfurtransferase
MRRVCSSLFLCFLLLGAAEDPWSKEDILQPAQLASDTGTPLVIHVGFPVLYRAAHIKGSVYAGRESKEEGIESLRKAVEGQPHDRPIVLYCGCCPWEKCPNIRPAFRALHEAGFTHVKVMIVPENLKADWIDKGYPTEKR